MKKLAKIGLAALLFALNSTAAAAPHWGEFRDDGVQTVNVSGKATKVRVYQAILWDIPWGDSWEVICNKTSATIDGYYFPRPTACVKSSALQPLSVILTGVSAVGLAWTPAGPIALAGAVGAHALDFGGHGALNMWGVFMVPQEPVQSSVAPNFKTFGKPINAAVQWKDKAYFFTGNKYHRHTIGKSAPDFTTLKNTATGWKLPDNFNSGIDAAIEWNGNKVFLFKGEQYLRYTIGNSQPDSGYPKHINGWNFPAPFDLGVDAAVRWGQDKVYFFKDDQYLLYRIGASQPETGYPRNISQWAMPGAFNRGIDAAINWSNNGTGKEQVYFFKDNQYVLYTVGKSRPETDYPKSFRN